MSKLGKPSYITPKMVEDYEKEQAKLNLEKELNRKLTYKDEILNLDNEYRTKRNILKSELDTAINGLKDFKENVRLEKKGQTIDVFRKRFNAIQQDVREQKEKIFRDEIYKLSSDEKTLNSVSSKEMTYISVILNSKDTSQILKLASKYKNNIDISDMIRATVSNFDTLPKQSIIKELDSNLNEIREIEEELNSLGFNNVLDENNFFKRM